MVASFQYAVPPNSLNNLQLTPPPPPAAPLETIGLFGFAWTSSGPPIHWIAPMIFSLFIAIANVSGTLNK